MDLTQLRATPRAVPQAGTWRTPDRTRLRRAVPYLILFLLLFSAYCYTPPRWADWNQNSRLALTLALVDHGTTRIDAYVDTTTTGDYAQIGDHRYSDKAPGLSLLAVPAYVAVRAMQPFGLAQLTQRIGASSGFADTLNPNGAGLSAERIELAIILYLLTILTVALASAGLGVLIALCVERLYGCRTAGLLTALILGLATPIFPYAGAFYGHLPAAVAAFAALALLILRPAGSIGNGRLAAFGALCGLAIVIEYPAALTLAPIVLWALALGRWRAVIYGTLGAIPPLAALVGYDLAAFGTPWPIGYAHSALWQDQHQQGFLSLTYPKVESLLGLTISPFRGLFFFAPVLLMAIVGIALAWRERASRVVTVVALASFCLTLAFAASSAMWWGGFAVGPRYLLPGVPFLALPLGALVAWLNSQRVTVRLGGLGLIGGLAALSLALVWATTFARQSFPPDTVRDPLRAWVWPALQDGDLARNVGMALGLRGVASLLPLGVILAIGVVALAASLRPSAAGRVQA
jgi:hypothetical protein